MSDSLCYCGSQQAFAECCEPIIADMGKAHTPEELMRARYSAHASGKLQFLVDSVHPDHRKGVSIEELEQWSKGLAKQDRKRRNVGLKILVTIVLLILIAFGGAVFLYTQGWGYPTQETVVKQLFADPQNAVSTVFSSEVDSGKAASMVEPVVQDANPAIDGMNKSMSDSTVYVTAKTAEGGDMQYKVSLVRDMIGWKVSSVDLYFPSQN